jgi:hypothetical protein
MDAVTDRVSLDLTSPIVLIDAENVRRSAWPNVPRTELVRLVEDWAARQALETRIYWEGEETADDAIAREAGSLDRYWLVSSDRGLRQRAGGGAERVIGGGTFLRQLRGGS